ncbi:MAG: ComEA family DNA-binding protein [Kocuria sp.]|nr:ComEA family DNA-binding protein [Kocuria sp.]
MSPVNHRGRSRLGPDAPVERLRGLLADDAVDHRGGILDEFDHTHDTDHAAVPVAEVTSTLRVDEQSVGTGSSRRSPVRWKVPWAAVVLALVALIAVMASIMWPDAGRTEGASLPDGTTASLGVMAPTGEPDPGHSAAPRLHTTGAQPETVYVHVVGEVKRPGVVKIPGDGRVQDAVEAAGGLTPDAVVDHVNLAAPVTDGAQIVIPDAAGDQQLATQAAVAPGSSPTTGGNTATSFGSPDASGAGQGLVNLNTATEAELETLPRVGPVMAQRIIEHRDRVGGFRNVEELDDVSGIGSAMLATLTPLVTV